LGIRKRGYEVVREECIEVVSTEIQKRIDNGENVSKRNGTQLPVCSDLKSAGDDFFSKETVTIQPKEQHKFWTDVKAYMGEDEVLIIDVRSSIGDKENIMLANTIGIVDSSYYGNEKNDGNIGISLYNYGETSVTIEEGQRIAQGVFLPFLAADNRIPLQQKRKGGYGHTGK